MTIFGILAMILAATGVFGITARGVAQRERELGIRMALGASTGRLLIETLSNSLRIGLLGVAAGVLAAFWASDLVAGFLFGIDTTDPLTYAVAVFLAIAVNSAAAVLPSRQVAAVDPARVSKEE